MNPSPDGLPSDLPYPDFITDGDAQMRYDTFASYPPQVFKSQIATKSQKNLKKKTDTTPMLNRVSDSVWNLNTKVSISLLIIIIINNYFLLIN